MDFSSSVVVTTLPQSQVQLTGELPFELLQKERALALKQLGKNVELPGFRKGHVPEDVLVTRIGEMKLLSEMAERALAKAYPEMIKAHALDVLGQPQVSITKIAPNNPLGFTITVAVIPKISLPDYKEIAKTINQAKEAAVITDEDVKQEIQTIMRQKQAYERLQQKAAAGVQHTHADGTVHDGPAHGDGTVELPTPESAAADAEVPLPELTDEYVAALGRPGQFTDVADFKTKLKEHLTIEKQRTADAAHRAKITDTIIAQSEFAIPQIVIDSEIGQMFAQMQEDLERAKLKFDDYLAHIKKTKEDLVKEWLPAAEKRARLQLILNEISKLESLKPDQATLDTEVAALKQQYKDADERKVRIYVHSVLQNEAVMKMLEQQ